MGKTLYPVFDVLPGLGKPALDRLLIC